MQEQTNRCAYQAGAKLGFEVMAEEAARAWDSTRKSKQMVGSACNPACASKPVRPSSLVLLALAVGAAALGLMLEGRRRAREVQRAGFDATIAGQVSWVRAVECYEEAVKAAAPTFMDSVNSAVYRTPSAPAENGIAEPSAILHASCCHSGMCEIDKETMERRIAAARPIIARMASRSVELLSRLRGSSQ